MTYREETRVKDVVAMLKCRETKWKIMLGCNEREIVLLLVGTKWKELCDAELSR